MIYWLIGQPGTGKSTLAKLLKERMDKYMFPHLHLDGDDLRKFFGNLYDKSNFTKEYRIEQTKNLQEFVKHINNQFIDVIISTVNAYRDIREDFKKSNVGVVEIYVTKTENRGREIFNVIDFEPPLEDFIHIDTTGKSPEESFDELFNKL